MVPDKGGSGPKDGNKVKKAGGGGKSARYATEWICSDRMCQTRNFAERETCRECGAPRPEIQKDGSARRFKGRGRDELVPRFTDNPQYRYSTQLTDKERTKFSFLPKEPKKLVTEQPIAEERLQKWKRGDKFKGRARTKVHTKKMQTMEAMYDQVAEKAARAEFLLTEEAGDLDGTHITQSMIKEEADEATQQKMFDLSLTQFGPYSVDYTRNGRHLLLGGAKGHIAAFDWHTKKLHCEMNVMETVNDVKWLHQETMFAVAQKQWTYVYDNQGIEIHCLKKVHDQVQRLEYLPQHFLLVSSSAKGILTYLDTSYGKIVSNINTHGGRLDIMVRNPQSAVINLGHPNGQVSMWTPNLNKAAAKMLCHKSMLRDICIDATGTYMATTSMDRRLKVWDLRMHRELSRFRYPMHQVPSLVDFSQRGLLAVSRDNVVEVYKDMTILTEKPRVAYMYHKCDRLIKDLMFCPYEDVIGVGHGHGFNSLVTPGAGEPNFDALEANPFQSTAQRKQQEVRMLLDKVHPEMISLDNDIIKLDLETARELQAERNAKKFLTPDRIDYTPRHKKKGASKAGRKEKRKRGVKDEDFRKKIRVLRRTEQVEGRSGKQSEKRKGLKGKEGKKKPSALDVLRRKTNN